MEKSSRRYLWTKGGALGDFILALPSLEVVIGWGRVTVVIPARYQPLLHGYDVEVWDEEEPSWRHVYQGDPAGLQPFDGAVILRPDPEGILRAGLKSAGVGQLWYVDPRDVSAQNQHMICHYLRGLGISPRGGPPPAQLRVVDTERQKVRATMANWGVLPSRTVLMQPGSGGQAKRWPHVLWRSLGDRLQAEGFERLLSLGPVEIERGEGDQWRGGPWRLLPPLGLQELMAWQAEVVGVVGCDSGTTHLAAGVGAGVVGLFGPTDPQRWGPVGPGVRVVQAPGVNMASLSVAQVLDAVLEVSRAARPQLTLGVA